MAEIKIGTKSFVRAVQNLVPLEVTYTGWNCSQQTTYEKRHQPCIPKHKRKEMAEQQHFSGKFVRFHHSSEQEQGAKKAPERLNLRQNP